MGSGDASPYSCNQPEVSKKSIPAAHLPFINVPNRDTSFLRQSQRYPTDFPAELADT